MSIHQFFLTTLCSALILNGCASDNALSVDAPAPLAKINSLNSNSNFLPSLAVNIDHSTSTTTAELDISSGILNVGMTDEFSNTKMSLNALTAAFTVDGALPHVLHNVGTDVQGYPIAISVEDTNALTVEINTFDAVVDGEKNTIYMQNDFEFSVEVTNINAAFSSDIFFNADNPRDQRLTGTVSIAIPAGTQLIVKKIEVGDSYTEITKIESGGPMSIQGSNFFSFNETVTVGECFIWEDDYLGFGSGFERVMCSM